MNNKIVLIKRTSALFLATVLIAGTITAISPTFIIKGVNAQGNPYYGGGMDNSYDDRNSYGMDDSYGYSDYRDDKDKKYDSYGPPVYGMDDSYDDRKLYGNDNSYKSQYPSYGKDDRRDKSKDAIINKIKCINTNLNINGNNTADINVGNKGQGYSGAYSSGVNGEEGYNGYYDGYDKKKGKGFDDCIINNNNTNTNIISGGNQTTPPEDLACEECFAVNSTLQTALSEFLLEFNGTSSISIFTEDDTGKPIGEGILIGSETDTIEQLCAQIENAIETLGVPMSDELIGVVLEFFLEVILEEDADFQAGIDAVIECLLEAGIIVDRDLFVFEPDSLSANGIAGANVQCTGDPLCARLQ